MKKIFSLFAAVLFAGSMIAADVTISNTMAQYAADNQCTIASGQGTQTCYTSLNWDNNIVISTTGSANCGSFWSDGTWRLYQNKEGNLVITANNGCTLKSVIVTYVSNNSGVLLDGEDQVASDAEQTISGTSKTYTVGNTGDATNGQARVKAIKVVYDDPSIALSNPIIEGAEEFFDQVEVSISCATEGAKIYYTLDGQDPTTESILYENPFTLTADETTVKAIAVKDQNVSEIVEKNFLRIYPWTVSQALANLESQSSINGVYVGGMICEIEGFNANYGSITYWITDSGAAEQKLKVYSGLGLNGAKFEGQDDLKVGDKVVVFGNLLLYGNDQIPEINYDNYLVSLESGGATAISNTTVESKAVKVYENGQLIIIKNGVRYDALGQMIR